MTTATSATTAPQLELTLYSKPSCTACTSTKRKLNDLGVPFTELNLTDGSPRSVEALAFASARSITEAPLLVVGPHSLKPLSERQDITVWSGFRPDLLEHFAPQLTTTEHEQKAA